MKEGTNAAEFEIGRAFHYQIGDMSFHSHVTVKCNTKIF